MKTSEKRRQYSKEYYEKNKEKICERTRNYRKDNIDKIREYEKRVQPRKTKQQQERMMQIKKQVFKEYGNKCVCCGETIPEFLSIDHINGDGYKHRKELKKQGSMNIYRWLIKNKFPQNRFQILCFNCNLAKGFYGKCPHKKEVSDG